MCIWNEPWWAQHFERASSCPYVAYQGREEEGTLGTRHRLLKTSATPEMQAHLLGDSEVGNIRLDGQRFQTQYWNETGGWYFFGLNLVAGGTEEQQDKFKK